MLLLSAAISAAARPAAPTGAVVAQASASTLRALQSGHLRVQVNVHAPPQRRVPMTSLCEGLVGALEREGRRTRIVFNGVDAAMRWRRSSTTHTDRYDVLSAADWDDDDDALVLVAPTNRDRRVLRRAPLAAGASDWPGAPHPAGLPSDSDEPDGMQLEAVQTLLYRARDRPVVLVNADLEAVVLSARAGRPVPPMFLSDFEHAYFYATDGRAAVRRAFPLDWEASLRPRPRATARHGRAGALPPSPRAPPRVRRRTSRRKPLLADVLVSRLTRAGTGDAVV